MLGVEVGSVIRKFEISFPSPMPTGWLEENPNAIINALMDEENAIEALWGHTGFIVEIENDRRSDEVIMASLRRRLKAF